MKIYTRTGDEGETSLFGGGRISKDSIRVTAYGQVDELNATLGVVLTTEPVEEYRAQLEGVQHTLFSIGGYLASPQPDKVHKALEKARIGTEVIAEIEATIDEIESHLDPLRSFVLPGGSPKAAQLHLARTVCRRAERSVCTLAATEEVEQSIPIYLNRLSDLLFVMARAVNRNAGVPDRTW